MKTENKIIHTCDFCKKIMFRKHAMVNHEKWCFKNPLNMPACSDCAFIEKVPHYYWVDGDYGESEKRTTKFHCKKLKKDMYPLKAQKKGLIEKYPESFEDQQPMPIKCDSHRYEWDNVEFE